MVYSTISPPSGAIEVVVRKCSVLKANPQNPKEHSSRQIKQIARSIQTFGFNVPVLVDRDLVIIAGHARLSAAQSLGWTEVPTIRLEHLTPAQVQAFMIADNRLAEHSTWNETLLAQNLLELSKQELDFSLETIGFEMAEIDLKIEALNAKPEAADQADNIPPVHEGIIVTQRGDRWSLGRHRLLCGDARAADDFSKLMEGEKASLAFTDVPYNVRIDGHASGMGRVRHREFLMAAGEMTAKEYRDFLRQTVHLHAAYSRSGSLHYVCIDWRHVGDLLSATEDVYSELKNICVWVKHNAGMGSLYRSQHEFVAVFKNGDSSHRNNVQLGRFGRNRTNVWNYRGANDFGRPGDEGRLLEIHPTVKPVALVADAILDASTRGDVVLDGFLGSGTTLIAAERVGRRCYGIEIDPAYVDVIIRRWQALTGDEARHIETGRTFSEMQAESQSHVG
jgi:DNA modification methylase